MKTAAVVGLGYVGLPLAVALGRKIKTIGFDINEDRLNCLSGMHDPNGDLSTEELAEADQLVFTSNPLELLKADVIIVAVPTPIDGSLAPDLGPLKSATKIVGENMKPGVIVVFESTVYPGCTEEVCVPILKDASGFSWVNDTCLNEDAFFRVGYSPERINPGDNEHRLENTTKIISGDNKETLDIVEEIYSLVVDVDLHRASSIKVAEAAKVIENSQRDLNIAFMNELAIIFDKLGIDTSDVLEAAGTKWNFLPFRPGLVGGHCIGVDPYYLTYKARTEGYHSKVILAGRDTNDGMGKFIAQQTIKQLAQKGHPINGAKVNILGLTFKEDCPDLRNSRVGDIIKELKEYQCEVHVHDPIADEKEALEEYGVQLESFIALPNSHATILAVGHKEYKRLGPYIFSERLLPNGILLDVKSFIDRDLFKHRSDINLWRL